MPWLLSQTSPLTDVQRGVRDHFERGGAIGPVVFVALALLAVVLLAYVLTRYNRSPIDTVNRPNPHRVFGNLLDRLALTPPQHKGLETMSKDLSLAHPSAILLSHELFDQQAEAWQTKRKGMSSSKGAPCDAELLADIRSILFPSA